jgi:hypothetical protein
MYLNYTVKQPFTGKRDDTNMDEFMQGGIKIKTMNDYYKDIKMFEAYLEERGELARVQNYLLDPIEGTTNRTQEQATELARYAKWLTLDTTLSVSAFDSQFYAIRRLMMHHLRTLEAFEVEFVKEAKRIGRGIVAGARKKAVACMEPTERAIYDARYGPKLPSSVGQSGSSLTGSICQTRYLNVKLDIRMSN